MKYKMHACIIYQYYEPNYLTFSIKHLGLQQILKNSIQHTYNLKSIFC
jgi:hypothetical protein